MQPETESHPYVDRSYVKIGMTAKGEATVEVKTFAGQEDAELEAARQLAVRTYNDTAREVRAAA